MTSKFHTLIFGGTVITGDASFFTFTKCSDQAGEYFKKLLFLLIPLFIEVSQC